MEERKVDIFGPLQVYIGYDERETVAYHVLAHSILKRSTVPVAIVPLRRETLGDYYYRPKSDTDSTDFSNSRWIIPKLQGYYGVSVFMDCDMLMLGDINDMFQRYFHSNTAPVHVVKHNHKPKETTKFLDTVQTAYSKKNWSSLMIFNNERCQQLTKHIVNTMASPLWFHQFAWVPEEEIGEIGPEYNHLVGVQPYNPDAELVHFTLGGPWHGYNYEDSPDRQYAELWWAEYEDMLHGTNPINYQELKP